MSAISLVQFEDQDGNNLTEVLQVPNDIELGQLQSIVNTRQDLFLNGNLIITSLSSAMSATQLEDVEQIKKIKVCKDLPSAKPAFYCSSVYSGHEGPVLATMYANDILVTAGGDKTVRFWDLITKTQFKVVQKHTHWVQCLGYNKDYIVSGGMDGLVNIYDYQGTHIRTLAKHKNAISILKVLDDKIISCSRDNYCVVWDFCGTILTSWCHAKPIRALSTTGDYILTGGSDCTIRVYKNLEYYCNLPAHSSQVNCIESYGQYTVSGDDDGTIIIWKSLKFFRRLNHKREVISLSINPNGLSFASASFDKSVKVWSLETGENLCTYFHVNLVYKVKVLNDMIVSCSKDKTIKMFKISQNKVISDLVCDDEVYDFDYYKGHLVCGARNSKVYFFN